MVVSALKDSFPWGQSDPSADCKSTLAMIHTISTVGSSSPNPRNSAVLGKPPNKYLLHHFTKYFQESFCLMQPYNPGRPGWTRYRHHNFWRSVNIFFIQNLTLTASFVSYRKLGKDHKRQHFVFRRFWKSQTWKLGSVKKTLDMSFALLFWNISENSNIYSRNIMAAFFWCMGWVGFLFGQTWLVHRLCITFSHTILFLTCFPELIAWFIIRVLIKEEGSTE